MLTETAEKRVAVKPEARPAQPAPAGQDDLGRRTPSDLRHLVDGLLRAQESERARVSGLLAEEVMPVMTMARYLIEDAARRLARGEPEDTSESLQNAAARILDATHQLVALSQELRPRVMDDLGLLPALAGYFREFSQANRAVFVSPRFTLTESEIPAGLKLAIFRILQEALSNVARHSKASTVRVLLSLFEGELRLSVEDNGVGFDVDRWRHRRHGQGGCGLGIISRWVEASGGHCSIESIPRHGTRVQAFWRTDPVGASSAAPQESDSGSRPGLIPA